MAARNRRRPGAITQNKRAPKRAPTPRRQRVVLYARVSSTEQHAEGFSIEAQQELLRRYAADNDLDVAREFVDVETAKKAGRTEFSAMLAFLEKTEDVRTILVEKTDRLYRNISDWVTLDGLDVEIHLVKEGGVLSDDSKSHEKFIHGIKVLMAKNYIDNLSEEVKKGLTQKAKQGGWPGRAPLGYKNVRSDTGKNVLILDPVRAPLVAGLFERYAEGADSIMSLVRWAHERGLRTTRGKQVSRAAIHYLLQNPIYMGMFSWNGEWYEGKHQPLITGALFDAVQDMLDSRSRVCRRKRARVFMFSGLIECGTCRAAGEKRLLVGELKKGQYVYYSCAKCRRAKTATYYREPDLQRLVLEQLDRLHMPQHVMDLVKLALRGMSREITDQSEADRERLRDKERQIRRNMATAYDDRLRGRLQPSMFSELSEGWNIELEQIRSQLLALHTADARTMDMGIALLELGTMARQRWESLSNDKRRRLLHTLRSNSHMVGEELVMEWRIPFDLLTESPWQLERDEAVFDDENGLSTRWLRDCVPTRNYSCELDAGEMALRSIRIKANREADSSEAAASALGSCSSQGPGSSSG